MQAFANPNELAWMSNKQLTDLTQPQRDQLAFVELRARTPLGLGYTLWPPVRRRVQGSGSAPVVLLEWRSTAATKTQATDIA